MATERDKEFPELLIIDFPGGCPMVVDPQKPHLGGNMRGGDAGTYYPETLWPWLLKTFSPKTVMDVGCAEGHALRWFKGNGCIAIGVEGLPQNAKRCGVPVVVHDLQDGPFRIEGVDLIWCCDVVEHVEEKYLANVLETLKQAPLLAMVHGTKDHDLSGWHHVNNKDESYWIEKLASVEMIYDAALTTEARKIAATGWFTVSGKIFRRKQK